MVSIRLLISIFLITFCMGAISGSSVPFGKYIMTEYYQVEDSTFSSWDMYWMKGKYVNIQSDSYDTNYRSFGKPCESPLYKIRNIYPGSPYSAERLSGGEIIPIGVIEIYCSGDSYYTIYFEILPENKLGLFTNGYYLFFEKSIK